jgi:hypothetical protein
MTFHRSTASRVAAVGVFLLFPLVVAGQERVDGSVVDRIKAEGFQRSQVMETASWLTDVYGPRLTNSPIARQAGEWAVKQMKEWGLTDPHLEWFPFGRGWINERNVAQVVAPVPYVVHVFPGAWTSGTNGAVTSELAIAELPPQPTDADYAKYKGQLRGKVVLAAPLPSVSPMFTAPGRRLTTVHRLAGRCLAAATTGSPGACWTARAGVHTRAVLGRRGSDRGAYPGDRTWQQRECIQWADR